MALIKDLSRQLQTLQKQTLCHSSGHDSRCSSDCSSAKVALGRKTESPTPFTVNAVGSSGARKNNLSRKGLCTRYRCRLPGAFEFGGDHKLNSSALLNPKNIKLNKYGNMPRNKLRS
ncbi:hypothetical protein [Klebsiella pneumoniae]|uniref:hypothetical protein n=1 Tax=Klebsiella pneumoniae TaxID=573 RepID=UPI001D198066|nr:hypothetical protein [Klebsiella pneumoniae]